MFVQFYHVIQTQFENFIKWLRSDNGKEYVNHHFLKKLLKNMVLFMNLHVLILHNKMVLQKGKIVIYLKSLGLYFFKCLSVAHTGVKLF